MASRYLVVGASNEYVCETHHWARLRGDTIGSTVSEAAPVQSLIPQLERRYGATRFVISTIRIFALFSWAGAIFMASKLSEYRGLYDEPLTFGWITIVMAVIGGMFMLAAAEGLQIVLDMEEHQRAMRLCMERQERTNMAGVHAGP